MVQQHHQGHVLLTRRGIFVRRRSVVAGLALLATPAWGDDGALMAAMRTAVGDRVPEDRGVSARLPAIAENGGQVPLTVSVDSPMTDADHVTAIHVFATRNPTPGIASFTLTPAMGRAEIQTRIRMAEAQSIVVLAVLSNGTVLRATAEAKVTQGGCLS